MRAGRLKPLTPYPGYNEPWECECLDCGKTSEPRLSSVKQGNRCRHCGHKRTAEKLSVDPHKANTEMRKAGIEPVEPYPGKTTTPWRGWCRRCESPTVTTLLLIRTGSCGCRSCGIEISVENRRTKSEPAAVQDMVCAGLLPLEPFEATRKPWNCRCLQCHRDVTPTLDNIRQGHSGCVYCAGIRVDEEEAVAFMRSVGAEPLESYPGAREPWLCRCTNCENNITPSYMNAKRNSGVCLFCAPYGIDYLSPAVVYLLRHDKFGALKIGIASQAAHYDRLGHHARYGWEVLAVWPMPTGRQAAAVEKEILQWWRLELGKPAALNAVDMPQGGFTETVSLMHLDVAAIKARIDCAIAGLEVTSESELPLADEVDQLMADG